MDLVRRKMFKPNLRRVREVEGEVSDDEIIHLRPAGSTSKAIVIEPKAGIRLLGVLGDVGGRTVPLRYVRATDVDAEDSGARGLRAYAAVLVAVVTTASARPVRAADRGAAIVTSVLLAPIRVEDVTCVMVRACPRAGWCNRTSPVLTGRD